MTDKAKSVRLRQWVRKWFEQRGYKLYWTPASEFDFIALSVWRGKGHQRHRLFVKCANDLTLEARVALRICSRKVGCDPVVVGWSKAGGYIFRTINSAGEFKDVD